MIPLTLLDYGVGNIHSLKKSFERAGAKVSVESEPARVLAARALLMPGVGAFGKVAGQLAPIRDELKGRMDEGLPTLAICIGMQVLYESSDESEGKGLSVLDGRVKRLDHPRLPHIGWNSVGHEESGPLEGVAQESHFYFVHSFAPPAGSDGCVATTTYGKPFAAAAVRDSVWAVQFHPEKSSTIGFRVVENFVRFAGDRA